MRRLEHDMRSRRRTPPSRGCSPSEVRHSDRTRSMVWRRHRRPRSDLVRRPRYQRCGTRHSASAGHCHPRGSPPRRVVARLRGWPEREGGTAKGRSGWLLVERRPRWTPVPSRGTLNSARRVPLQRMPARAGASRPSTQSTRPRRYAWGSSHPVRTTHEGRRRSMSRRSPSPPDRPTQTRMSPRAMAVDQRPSRLTHPQHQWCHVDSSARI